MSLNKNMHILFIRQISGKFLLSDDKGKRKKVVAPRKYCKNLLKFKIWKNLRISFRFYFVQIILIV